jgi:cytochrome c oxidase assembly protein subunit 11
MVDTAVPVRKQVRVALICCGVFIGMLAMSYAAVPLYDLFCRVTGYGGTTQRAQDTSGKVLDRTITVRFDANTHTDLSWDFQPVQRAVEIKIGEKSQIFYRATNVGSLETWGTASFNVSPPQAGVYFNKIECFCFTEQHLAAGQSVDMPVIFFIDPDIADDPLLKNADTITLSYTFFVDEDALDRDAEQANLETTDTAL